jgi:hypothetical protein
VSDPVAADAYRVLVGPEEVFVDFGRVAPPQADGDITIALSHRFVMPPRVASRLASLLRESTESLGIELEPAQPEPAPPPRAAAATPSLEALLHPTRSLSSSRAEPSSAAEAAARMFRVVGELGVPYAHERSFRLRAGSLSSNRFLLSVRPRDLAPDAAPRLLAAARALEMPPPFLELAARHAPGACGFHFGFEDEEGSSRYKVYLESSAALQGGARAEPGAAPVRLHLAFKWDPSGAGEPVVTEYLWHPALESNAILDRVAEIYGGTTVDNEPFRVTNEILMLAARRMPERDIQYLEVVEANGRRSFDLNFYDAELELRDLFPLLSRMRRYFDVPAGRFQALYDQIKSRAFGHLAGGTHRRGESFFTVYYGVEGHGGAAHP